MSVRSLAASLFPHTTRHTTAARFARWGLQRLEDRVTPADLNLWAGRANDGLWSNPDNWELFHVPTSGEDAIINNGDTVTHGAGDDLAHMVQVVGASTLVLSGGSITTSTLDLPGGGHFNLTGGTLAGATLTASSTLTATTSGGTLSGVTVAGTLDVGTVSGAFARVSGDLTLSNGTVLIGSNAGSYGILGFDGAQTLGGTGAVVFGTSIYDFLQAGPTAGSALTIGPGVTVRGHTGGVGFSRYWGGTQNVTFTNQGTIQADVAGGNVILEGTNWSNTGTAKAAGGTLTLAGSWTNGGNLKSAGDAATITDSPGGAAEVGNTVTITTTAAHGFTVGQSVTISGMALASYNGTFTITSVPTATTFTYTHPSSGLAASGGGTATLNSTLNLDGIFATPTLGAVATTGGVINLTGTAVNTGSTLTLNAGTGSWRLAGGTISGGTIATAGGAALVGTNLAGNLTGVTLAGTLDIGTQNGALVLVTGGLTLTGGTVLLGTNAGNYGLLEFDGGSQTLGGTGTVVFGTSIYDFLRAGPTAASSLTIGPNVLVRGHTGAVGYSPYWGGPGNVTFTNQGTIQADTTGGTIILGGDNWSNTGTLRASAGGSLTLNSPVSGWTSSTPILIDGGGALTLGGIGWTTAGVTLANSTLNLGAAFNVAGTFTRAGLGTFTRTGGTVNITGMLDNTGNTLTLDAATGPWQLYGGTIAGGTVTTSGGNTLLGTTAGGSLNGVTLAGTLDLGTINGGAATVANGLTLNGGTILIGNNATNYGYLNFEGTQTLGGTGTVVFGNNSYYNVLRAGPSAGSHLTIGPGVTVRGKAGGVGYSPYWGGATDVSVTVQGTVQAEGDTTYGVLVGNATNFAAGTLTGGTWKAVNGTLRILGANITTNAATIVVDGATANVYGDMATSDALGALAANAAGGSLTVQNGHPFTGNGQFVNSGDLTIGSGSTATVTHPFANSVIAFSSEYHPSPGSWSAFQATGPSNTPGYGDYSTSWTSQGGPNVGPAFLTLGFANPDFADGVIVRETFGNGFVTQVDAIDTNNVSHTVWPVAGETDTSQPGSAVNFLASWPRTGYRVQAVTIHIDTDRNSNYEEIDSVQLVTASTGFTQAGGHLTVAAGGTLALPASASYIQTGGTTTVNGTLSATVPVAVQGGLLEGTGTVAADLTNAAVVAPGPGLGTLTVTGNYTQTAAGTLAIETGGAGIGQTDRLAVGGAVTLDGALTVGSVNGYLAAVGDTLTVLDPTVPGTISGHFVGIPVIGGTLDSDGPTTFAVSYAGNDGNDVTLTAINRAPTLDTDPLTVLDPVPVRTKLIVEAAGTLVSALIAGRTDDADGDSVGIAISGLDPANTLNLKGVPRFGVWQFTTDGITWNPIPRDVSTTGALVLSADAVTRVRFLPNLNFHGLSRFTFLAWDHTDDPANTAAGTQVNTTVTPTAYSDSTHAETAWVAVGKTKPAVNAAGATVLAAVREDAKASSTFAVKSLLGLAGLEAAPVTGLGVAITGVVNPAAGTWYYRLAKTKTFIAIDPATTSPTNALLLRPTDSLRFVPAHDANGSGELTFKTWVPDPNVVSGSPGNTVTGSGFGRDSGAASIPITPVNDAPVLNPALHPDLGTVAAGPVAIPTAPMTVSDLLALAPGIGSDVDGPIQGVQLLPASATVGRWQYQKSDGTWATATKPLGLDVQVRFLVAAKARAGAYNLSFKVWDGKLVSKLAGTATLTVG